MLQKLIKFLQKQFMTGWIIKKKLFVVDPCISVKYNLFILKLEVKFGSPNTTNLSSDFCIKDNIVHNIKVVS